MGKVIKSAAKGIVKAVGNIPGTVKATAKDVLNAAGDTGKALVNTASGKSADWGGAASHLLEAGANTFVTATSAGMTSLNDPKKGTNSADAQIAGIMNKDSGDAPVVPTDVGIPTEVEDPYLKEELANSRKRGRASTVLGGATDSVGGTSARRSLLA